MTKEIVALIELSAFKRLPGKKGRPTYPDRSFSSRWRAVIRLFTSRSCSRLKESESTAAVTKSSCIQAPCTLMTPSRMARCKTQPHRP